MSYIMKKCYACKVNKSPDQFSKDKSKKGGLQGKCNECRRAYRKTPAGKEATKKSITKYQNAHKARKYFDKRRPTPPDRCSACHSINRVEAHHHDYNLPMNVTYLCLRCHRDWHSKNTPLNRAIGIFTS